MAGRGGRNIQYTAQDEPAFIKRFKEKVGYKEDIGIEAKQHSESNWSDEESPTEDKDDEKPVVVVIKAGDLTAEQAEDLAAIEGHQTSDEGSIGRIVFRKPTKRDLSENEVAGLSVSTPGSKKVKRVDSREERTGSSPDSSSLKDADRKQKKKSINSNLLSFDDDA